MRRSITPEFYDALVDCFRETPGNCHVVSNRVKSDPRSGGTCGWATAKKAWYEGWPSLDLRPIKDELQLEEMTGSQLLVNEVDCSEEDHSICMTTNESIMRDQAREDAIAARISETRLVREARQNIVELLSNSKELLRGYSRLAPRVVQYLSTMSIETNEDAEQATRLLWRIATTSRAATESGMKVLQMERLLLGQPMEIIGAKEVDGISDFDALAELECAAAAAERVRERKKRYEVRLANMNASDA